MIVALSALLVGFILLIWSADYLVDNASVVAQRLGVSTFLIGVIIIGFGTSAPEMFVSAMAAIQNKGNLALGNALGSNITNIGLVLGSAALIKTLPVSRSAAKLDIPIVLATGLLAIFLVSDGILARIDGFILMFVLLAYLLWSAKSSSNLSELDTAQNQSDSTSSKSTLNAFVLTIVSIIVLIIASRLLVYGSVVIATHFGVSELIIGLTIVAIGTSLPELAAAVAAARKGVHDMIIGNIIGSNVFNTLGVLGITGTIRATEIDINALWRDFPIMFLFTVFMLIFALSKRQFSRIEGALLLSGYVGYICYLFFATIK